MYGDVYNDYNSKRFENRGIPVIKRNGMDYHSDTENHYDLDYGDYEDVGTPMAAKVSWLGRKMGRLDSVRSNNSLSSSSTYIYGSRLAKKSSHKSQISLYEKISRKFSLFDANKSDGRSRKSSRQRSVSDTAKPSEETLGVENKAFEKDEASNAVTDDFDNINLILDKKLLETITENQNRPYSTQASHNTSRRMSAQSIFGGTARRGSVQKEPFSGPVMELFHENETEENIQSLTRSQSPREESLTGSQRSRESGVGSLADIEIDPKIEANIDENVLINMSQDENNQASALERENEKPYINNSISPSEDQELILDINMSSTPSSDQGSPSPSLPKR